MQDFFVEFGTKAGNHCHHHHAKMIDPSLLPFPTRLLTKNDVEITKQVVEATCNKSVGRNFLHKGIGRFINSIKIAYLCSKHDGEKSEAEDDISRMLENFESSEEIAYTCLSDVPIDQLEGYSSDLMNQECPNTMDCETFPNVNSVTVSTTKSAGGCAEFSDARTIDGLKHIEKEVKEERSERKLMDSETLFIAIAWTILPALRFFKLCPEVVWCDVTSHTNNKGFHLLSFSCRTSIDKQVIFLWIWIPNQQRFSFRWVFQHAIPNLIPSWLRNRVRFIMKDGDPQQRNEIIYAMIDIFKNAIEGGCGYHIGE